ncbi:MAG: hypothetical protein M1836_004559 [Candelina mexicana]|nr:MAG: hypothetical protein M1836_004559 [Candelina mexicana]
MAKSNGLQKSYPWTLSPLIACAPMRLIALAPLAVAVSQAGGLGFLAAGTDCSSLDHDLAEATSLLSQSPSQIRTSPCAVKEGEPLSIGVGFINWGADLEQALSSIRKYVPAAVWFFAPKELSDLVPWTEKTREVTEGRTKVWIQIGTVADALNVANSCRPDVIVVQGTDAGGHGLERGAGIISLLPEVADALEEQGFGSIHLVAAGGIVEGRGVAASLVMGASGVAMGTRFLAAKEATIAKGYQDEVVRASDGGITTIRSTIYDRLRGITDWPKQFNGRGIINQTFVDAQNGMDFEENQRLYKEEIKKGNEGWGLLARMTTYAGTGIGLVKEVQDTEHIIQEIRRDALSLVPKL